MGIVREKLTANLTHMVCTVNKQATTWAFALNLRVASLREKLKIRAITKKHWSVNT
jgi:hypothetical protein